MYKSILYFEHYDNMVDFLKNHKKYNISLIDIISEAPIPNRHLNLLTNIFLGNQNVSLIALMSGLLGLVLSIIMIYWVEGIDYKLNLGGKPFFMIISSMPVIFVISILFSTIAVMIFLFVKIKKFSFIYTNAHMDFDFNENKNACIVEYLSSEDEIQIEILKNAFNVINVKRIK